MSASFEKKARTASGSRGMVRTIVLILLAGTVVGLAYLGIALVAGSPALTGGDSVAKNVLTTDLAAPLNGATAAKIEINVGDGNLTVDPLAPGEQLLASGSLQYLENQSVPQQNLTTDNGHAALRLIGGESTKQSWFRLPWAACNGATDWRIHLNREVAAEITAHSNGGNVKLGLAGMSVTNLTADTGGGNMEVVLPEGAKEYGAVVQSGAGNVDISLPRGVAARVYATSGLGNVIVDPRFVQVEKHTYQSSDYDGAAKRVEITAKTGAGNVNVSTR